MNEPSAAGDGKSRVLEAIDIVDLIGRSVALKRRGKDYVGLCPFHQEKTPSFSVSPGKQVFYCYGCKTGGNAIDFVMKRDRIEFVEALQTLARQAGVELPRFGGDKQNAGQRQALLEATSAACALFEKSLSHPQLGKAARVYLGGRGITPESVRQFQIGLAVDSWDALLSNPAMKKFPPPLLQQAGLIKPRENGTGFYDTFRNRLVFPIRDENARVIAFGGRAMPGSADPAKYLNSPETALFSKSRCVYGLDLARQRIVETRTAVVVEGYTDVVVSHQFGVSNVVSVLGTALTSQQVGILRRFADRIVLLFDADTAGELAVNRAVELFLTQPVEIAIATMPPGVDPDEFLLQNGIQAFTKLLDAAQDALSYRWSQLSRSFRDTDDLTARQKTVREYLDLLAGARGSGQVDGIRWGQALARVSRLTDIPVNELHRQFRAGQTRKNVPPARQDGAVGTDKSVVPVTLDAQARAQRWIVGALLSEPQRWPDVQRHVSPQDFEDSDLRAIAQTIWTHHRDVGEPVLSEFLGLLEAGQVRELAVALVQDVEALSAMDRALDDALRHLQEARQRKEEQKLVAQLRRTSGQKLPESDEVDLLTRLQEQARRPDMRRV
ncbi:MAG: DNA primase [Tepidisphaeraceae bacterium]